MQEKNLTSNNKKALAVSQSQGGLTNKDIITPRAIILKEEKNGVKAGTFVNNITLEPLPSLFIPLFCFKNYAKFDTKLKVEWSTLNANDPRVKSGLSWDDGKKPSVTEFLNFVIFFEEQPVTPFILSCKRKSIKTGRNAHTMFLMGCGLGVPQEGASEQYINKRRYGLSTVRKQDGAYSWFEPVFSVPKDKQVHFINDEMLQNSLTEAANTLRRIIGKLSEEVANTEPEVTQQQGEEVVY